MAITAGEQQGIAMAASHMPSTADLASNLWQNAMNARMSKAQRKWNLEMWNRQNAYNTPAAQMQRYRDAGLNPNLAVSGGNPGNASQAPQAEKYTMEGPKSSRDVASELGKYQNISASKTGQELQFQQTQSEMLRQTLLHVQTQIAENTKRLQDLNIPFTDMKNTKTLMSMDQKWRQGKTEWESKMATKSLIEEQAGLYRLRKLLLAQQISQMTVLNKYLPASQLTNIIGKGLGSVAGGFVAGATGIGQINKLKAVKIPKGLGKIGPNLNF